MGDAPKLSAYLTSLRTQGADLFADMDIDWADSDQELVLELAAVASVSTVERRRVRSEMVTAGISEGGRR